MSIRPISFACISTKRLQVDRRVFYGNKMSTCSITCHAVNAQHRTQHNLEIHFLDLEHWTSLQVNIFLRSYGWWFQRIEGYFHRDLVSETFAHILKMSLHKNKFHAKNRRNNSARRVKQIIIMTDGFWFRTTFMHFQYTIVIYL